MVSQQVLSEIRRKPAPSSALSVPGMEFRALVLLPHPGGVFSTTRTKVTPQENILQSKAQQIKGKPWGTLTDIEADLE